MLKPAEQNHHNPQQPEFLADVARNLALSHASTMRGRYLAGAPLPSLEFDTRYDVLYTTLVGLDSTDLDNLSGIEWFLDNDYVIQEAIALVKDNTPKRGYPRLPRLDSGLQRGQLRVLVLADELINTCGLPLDLSWVQQFLEAYQQNEALTLGELWALPNMLRIIVLQHLAQSVQSMLSQLQAPVDQVPDYAAAVAGHVINLRTLAAENWGDFVESVSLVHKTLGRDPAGAYADMDRQTRNRYRYQVEEIARRTDRREAEVARHAIALAEDHHGAQFSREAHVGYYLQDAGRRMLIENLNRKRLWTHQLPAALRARMAWWFLASIATLTALILWPVVSYLRVFENWPALILFAPVALILAVSIAVNLLNWLLAEVVKPRQLAKMDFTKGVPGEFATAVVTPALLGDDAEIEHLLERMEMNYLGNRDPALCFVLLTDYVDAGTPELAEDASRLVRVTQGVEALNERYGSATLRPFLLFHRPRLWNPSEGCYMGWERKRGKLMEFNQLVLGDQASCGSLKVGGAEQLQQVRFVITLDTDTQLTPGAAKAMIGTLAHPLNQPVLDPTTPGVQAGYSMIQPRLVVYPDVVSLNPFTRAFAGDMVLDLYTHAVSDVYQDLFGVGIFAGKGIYDVRALDASLDERVPDNAILSHDLFEGLHSRVGLATDIALFEDYPDNLLAYARRTHRWIRGDWQLLPWLLPRVPLPDGAWGRNRFSMLDRWKLLDNLRRSLFSPAILAALIMTWTVLPGTQWVWILGILLVALIPITLGSVRALGSGIAQGRTLKALGEHISWSVRREVVRWLFLLLMLPYETFVALDAILRTLWRLSFSRRHLLQWVTAAQSDKRLMSKDSLSYFWLQMAAAPLTAIGLLVALVTLAPISLLSATPFLIAWFVAPSIAFWASRSDLHEQAMEQIDTGEQQLLRQVAFRTWQFFERFVGPENHWLPPDNYHEAPQMFVSRRTSPTNIGLMLLATISAYDFGYQSVSDVLPRLRRSFESLARLEKYRGHFFNWYRLDDLSAMEPRYVSAVDSGNLAASLIALRSALSEMLENSVPLPAMRSGLVDLLIELGKSVRQVLNDETFREIETQLNSMTQELAVDLPQEAWPTVIARFAHEQLPALQSKVLAQLTADAIDNVANEELRELRRAFSLVRRHLRSCLHESALLPWLEWRLEWPSRLASTGIEEIDAQINALCDYVSTVSLNDVPQVCIDLADRIEVLQQSHSIGELSEADRHELDATLQKMHKQVSLAGGAAQHLIDTISELANESERLVAAMDFSFLYDFDRHLLHLGYTVTTGGFDPNYYDLLASEARLASFVAIAKGDIPQEHWVHLGRPFTRVGSKRALVSWSATAFEYFMPHLLMRAPPRSLLSESCLVAVDQQRSFADGANVPWGISESGFYQLDKQAHYQYRAFGVPNLGLRLETSYRLVISPYASVLALPFAPREVLTNLERLIDLGMLGRYGLFEAVDFGVNSGREQRRARIVRSYMSHHQGMILVALDNALNDQVFVRRFHADPSIASFNHLLNEQIPRGIASPIGWRDKTSEKRVSVRHDTLTSWQIPVHEKSNQLKVLSNGHYQVMLNHTGMSGSFWDGLCLAGWQADVCDVQGSCLYLKDLDSQTCWSAGAQPIAPSDLSDCGTHFSPHLVEFRRRDHGIHLTMAVTVCGDEDVEVRRLNLTNDTDRTRRLLLISYVEPVLAPLNDHIRHPVFNKMFIETTKVPAEQVLIAKRRTRDKNETPIYFAHAASEFGGYERRQIFFTDRKGFLGRGGSIKAPAALANGNFDSIDDLVGSLDPILAIGIEIELPARAMTQLAFVYAVDRNRADVLRTIYKYRSEPRIDWAFHRARLRSQGMLSELGMKPQEVPRAMKLMSGVFAASPTLRAKQADLAQVRAIQPVLWSRGISGDLPVLLVHIRGYDDVKLAEELVRIHIYWDRQQVAIDLVLLDDEIGGYAQPTRTRLSRILEESRNRWRHYTQGNIYIVPAMELTAADRQRLVAAAWLELDANKGGIDEQLKLLDDHRAELPAFVPMPSSPIVFEPTPQLKRPDDLLFDNGFGGFSADGREYVIYLEPEQVTPAPWSNIIANPEFGFIVTDSGAMCTWSGNSGEHRLTPWANDPLRDASGEALFLRDEETGEVWSPTPQPMPAAHAYEIHHGAGYSVFHHSSHGLQQQVRLFADTQDTIKIAHLTLNNYWQRPRRITVTYYADWVLGVRKETSRPYIISEHDAAQQALFVRNSFSPDADKTAFLASSEAVHGLTTDRHEFLGRDGDCRRPAALSRIGLSGNTQASADPCAVLQVHVEIPAGGSYELHFLLGEGQDREHAADLVSRYGHSAEQSACWNRVMSRWDSLLGGLRVSTPDERLDIMVNRWLLYQTITCRLWARAALYQSGGGFGFRDQLQDVMALTHVAPNLARELILRAAAAQFLQGDVLHWWHEKPLRGVRTRCSDDMLWLPYVTAHYVRTTGDETLLHEQVAYLDAPELASEEDERYAEFASTPYQQSVLEHCRRAVERASNMGAHGLPLIGSGDWNDSLNRVGIEGRGESVWLGWFLAVVFREFAYLCELDGKTQDSLDFLERADALVTTVDAAAWDGDWYVRAFDDEGQPIGAAANDESSIDLNAQSWAVLAQAPNAARLQSAMTAVERFLIRGDNIVRLLAPPYQNTDSDPGYIKGYPPGVRENGAQYSHAATWAGWAYGELQDGDRALQVFNCVNPIAHSDSAEAAQVYEVEPYAVAADIYGVAPYVGRGGWTWYTGAAGWGYRLAVEVILGIRRHGELLEIKPCLPKAWPGYEAELCVGQSKYNIRVTRDQAKQQGLYLDGDRQSGNNIRLVETGGSFEVLVYL